MEGVEKDPIMRMPLVGPDQAACFKKKLCVGTAFFDLPLGLRCNCTILALRSLSKGFLLPVLRGLPQEGTAADWRAAGTLGRQLALRILDFHRSLSPPSDRPRGGEGLVNAGASSQPASSGARSSGGGSHPLPRKGDLCRAEVSKISLPAAGSRAVPMTALSRRAGRFLENFKDLMLHVDGPRRVAECEVTPFIDPSLRTRRSRVRLAARMWQSGLLRPVARSVVGGCTP